VLKKLEVKNFLALRDVSIDLEPFTVIVGPNASGKSTILEVLHRLCALRSEQRRVLVEGGDFPEKLDSRGWINPSEVLSKNTKPDFPFIQWQIYSESENIQINLQSEIPNLLNHWVMYLKISSIDKVHDFGYLNASTNPFSVVGLTDVVRKIVPYSINLRPNMQKMALASYSPLINPVLESDGSGLATACVNIQQEQPEAFERIQQSLRAVIPTIKRFRFHRTKATIQNYVNGEPKSDWTGIAEELIFDFVDADAISAKYVSEGTLLALCVLTAAARFEGEALVLIDDLERGLHPKAVHDLVKTLRELQKVNPKLQIVATSHSPYVLDELEPHEVRVVTRDADKGTIVGRLTDHPNFEKWKDAMLPGEFWSHVGEDWLLEKKQNV
jgi:predicted ATPase